MAVASVDLEDVRSYRNYTKSRCVLATRAPSFPRVNVDFRLSADSEQLPVCLEKQEFKLLSAEQEIRCRNLTVPLSLSLSSLLHGDKISFN